MLTKKREALVKLELASKNEKLPQAQEEVKEVRKLAFWIEIWFGGGGGGGSYNWVVWDWLASIVFLVDLGYRTEHLFVCVNEW